MMPPLFPSPSFHRLVAGKTHCHRQSCAWPRSRHTAAISRAPSTELERALRERTGALVWTKLDPALDPLRADTRFAAVVGRRTRRLSSSLRASRFAARPLPRRPRCAICDGRDAVS
jgi:hypothetical protein